MLSLLSPPARRPSAAAGSSSVTGSPRPAMPPLGAARLSSVLHPSPYFVAVNPARAAARLRRPEASLEERARLIGEGRVVDGETFNQSVRVGIAGRANALR